MRGENQEQDRVFSYISADARVPADHPLRSIRKMVSAALDNMLDAFQSMYSSIGRPSVPPEKLLRALLLQVLYSIRSERLLIEQLDSTCCSVGLLACRLTTKCGIIPPSPKTEID